MAFNNRRNRVDVDAIGEFINAFVNDINATYTASKNKYEKYAQKERGKRRGANCRKRAYSSEHFAANIIENKEEFLIEAVLPGFKRAEISIQIDGDLLKIKAQKKQEEGAEKSSFKLREFMVNPLKRAFKLSEKIDKSGIKAKSEDGILTVKLPKKVQDTDEPQTIEVS